MTDQSDMYRGIRLLIGTAALVIILWGVNQAQSVVVLFLVSAFLAVIGTVPVLWLQRKHIPSVAAVVIVVAAMITLLLSIGAVVGASLSSLSTALPFYQTRLHDLLSELNVLLARKGLAITDKFLLGYLNPGTMISVMTGLFTVMSSMLSSIVLIVFTLTFILLEASGFPAKLRLLQAHPKASFPQFTRFVNDIKRYVIIKTSMNLIAAILITIWLFILGVDFPVLWGFLAFILNFVPSVGSVVAAVPAVLLALVQLGVGSAALTAGGYVAIGMTLGNVVEPRIMGHRFGLSPLVVFVSLIFWGNLLGVFGALLCVPLTMTLKLACEESEETQWIAILLGPDSSSEGMPNIAKKRK
jgi:predicted PurR-regulated permease PerM